MLKWFYVICHGILNNYLSILCVIINILGNIIVSFGEC